ncbi:MAG: hypothetical protein M1820_004570 [Bogoriella megaspora]|nr:MAG: hypothetical protein M1820_004570 [Bogoriella megaspora]
MAHNGQPQHATASLPALPPHLQSDTHLTAHLASRFHVSLPTAQLSSHGLISLNTYTSSAKGPNGGKEGSAMGESEELASRAWTRLGARGEDQAVVYLGESGSGKTTLRNHLLTHLLNLSATPLSKKLQFAAFVFDTLTTTKSTTTPSASKSGLFFEVQYDTSATLHPTLIGGKLLDHRLERSRVATVPPGERNFHVLYYLLAGTSAAEKTHLGLDNPGHVTADGTAGTRTSATISQRRWRYLGHPSQMKVGINDAEGFQHFKTALRRLEFPRSEIAEICQILAAILHIGQLEFMTSQSTTPAADESGGYSHEGGEEITVVKNKEVLEIIAAFLGLSTQDLETSMGYKSKTLHRERVTVMLDPKGARENADELARTLYALLVAYVIEQINQRTCAAEESVGNTISVIDFPGFSQTSATGNALDQLLNNAATESLYHFTLQSFFERKADLLESEEVGVPATSYFDNSDAVKGLLKPGNGLLSILDDQTRRGKTDTQFLDSCRKRFADRNPAISVASATAYLPGSNFPTQNMNASFTVKHFSGEVEYPVTGMVEDNGEVISGDLMNLIKTTSRDFVRDLFGQEALNTVTHPKEKSTILQASLSSKPTRQPSMAKRNKDRPTRFSSQRRAGTPDDDKAFDFDENPRSTSENRLQKKEHSQQGASGQFLASLDNIIKSISGSTNPYFVFCLKPNDRRIANQFDSKCVRTQIQTFGIAEISQRLRNADFSMFIPFGEFIGLAEAETIVVGGEREKAEMVLEERHWPTNEAQMGATGVFLSERCWFDVAKMGEHPVVPGDNFAETPGSFLTPAATRSNPFGDSKQDLLASHTPSPGGFYHDDKSGGYFGSRDLDAKSDAGASAFNSGDMFRNMDTREQMAEKGNEVKMVEIAERPTSGSRKRWLFIVYCLTWFIPDFLVKWVGRMPRKDIRMAWREKTAINLIIWLSCAFVIFFMIGFPILICPTQHVYSPAELTSYNGKPGSKGSYVAIRGVVYDLAAFAPTHYPDIVSTNALDKYAGTDATNLFPVQVSAVCNGQHGSISPAVLQDYKSTNYTDQSNLISDVDPNAVYHDFRWFRGWDYRPDWWFEQQEYLKANYQKGRIGYTPKYVGTLGSKRNQIAILNNRIYDFTDYYKGQQLKYPGNASDSTEPDTKFMYQPLVDLFQQRAGQDISKYYQALGMSTDLERNMQICLNNLFYVGDVDTRSSPQCLFAKYILLAISLLLASVIGFKFLAALQFGKKNVPENLDKFVICTVPAYTEDEDSLRRAIDSAARMRYDDKRKLLVIICDGMIIGQGNDRPTPRIVLDILGVSETVDPDPLSFESLGEGMKQHNMGKVYSGLYEVQGHIVPFLVVVKIGKPSEVTRPGNRGKRDSQVLLMRFLNRVHYNLPMTPMELDMHHQIRNIIGVNPTFYEFLLQIDADTVVAPDSATRFVASFLQDTRLIGVCGETALTNAKASFITMMQVYEYYISHNLTKAFESLFGSVTCLPGCFTMYRIRAAETGKPLFVSKEVVDAYSEIRVDTLHMKNLLHLGEDRYLTTLLLKFHSKYKTKYIFRAHAWTIAPDSWKVFMSQRRRWINSTVHNLIELIPLQQLCGFCCFSMRFVVFLDLLSTVIQPVIIFYLVYLIINVSISSETIPITAIILLGAVYGLQAIIFILRRKWEMIGWMIIYLLATPVFAFGLPLYAFWHMDDFSWGNTRVVLGEKGRQIVVSDEGKFDPSSIPHKKWEEYQAELWDAQTQHDDTKSEISGVSYGTKSFYPTVAAAGSEYGGGGDFYTRSRPVSQIGMGGGTGGLTPPRPGYASHNPMNMSRMSLAASEPLLAASPHPGMGSRHTSAAFPAAGELEMSDLATAHLPSDDAILAEIRDILRTADLMSVTKKSIKAELERRFGVAMDAKRAYIGSATEAVLSGQL